MKKVFFASDFHLGIDGATSSRERERLLVRWLEEIAPVAEAVYLVGDLFDYWFEYKTVVPKGYLRLFGKLASLRDSGIPVYFFTGNHDMWMFGYMEEELGIPVYREPIIRDIGGRRFFIGHGDGLGPGDYGYKMIKRVFAHPVSQWLFARIHPNTGIGLMRFFSRNSRAATGEEAGYLGPEREWLVQFCEDYLRREDMDYFIFGHRHLPLDITLSNGRSRYVNLGDWLRYFTYAEWDGEELYLKRFEVKI
jgi:UDP-2,3-diacylglucosamine hydrolase